MTNIRQHDPSDCGAACLAGIATHYGKPLSVAHIRVVAGTDATGSTLADLQHTAQQLGFQAEAVQGDYSGLAQAPLPAVVHLNHVDTGAHFVVITHAGHRKVTILDPADGRQRRWPLARFESYWTGAALLLLPGPAFLRNANEPAPGFWRRMYQLLLPYRRYLVRAFALALCATGLALGGALFIGLLTDRIIPAGQAAMLHYMGLLFALILLLQVAASGLRKSITLRTARLIDDRLLRAYSKHLLQLPQSVFDSMSAGELLSRMGDVVLIRRLVNDHLIQSGVPALSLLLVLSVALAHHPALAWWLLLSIVAYAGIYVVSNALHRVLQRRLLVADAALDARFTETFGAMGTIKQLGAERQHGLQLAAHIHGFVIAAHATGRARLWAEEITALCAQGFSLALLWGGAARVLGGELSLGELVAFYTISGYFSAAAAQLLPLAQHVQEARVAAERLFGLLDMAPDHPPGATQFAPDDIFPVALVDVCFAYRRGHETLSGLSLTLASGTLTLIRGASGSGKSTLLAMLLQQYRPTAGGILLGVYPLEMVDPDILHRHIAAVPQRVQLFDDTLAANICLGEAPDPARLEMLCNELGLLPFIQSLPQQLDTRLGPDGCLLSGGQRQLVALARALYRQPRLLLLDEATSALDAATEARVHRLLLRRKATGMAILWVSHGDNSLPLADAVYQLDNGILTPFTDRSISTGAAATAIPDHGGAAPARNNYPSY
ncbi:peptidase domain-containing ABC transporter [Parapedobacter sp. 10938]|uniref:peptidase domain-containing ABC transporter n=1 Tax=Parapedobacter flavus TaxID=3110225 RepID=UPI002DB9F2A9|nr:peptidase domain-containing ABC transporter [Parapedobacter sp. 10938]MEC3881607.1 peptidase domain-containing ABC transporter [Parapedobacter sp. 10938]